ncbi:MAG: hypothetical protein ACOVT5_06000, partial [Armatimonadaceae bacterium]
MLGNSQSAPFYPPNLLFTAIGDANIPFGFGILLAFHLLLLGFGVVRLLTLWGLSPPAATIGGLVSLFNVHLMAWTPIASHISVLAWTPWILVLISRRRPIGAGCLMGIALLGGHLQMGAYVLGMVGLAELWAGRTTRWPQRICSVVVLCSVAIGLSAIQFIPALELGGQSHRGGVAATPDGYRAYVQNAIPIHLALTWIAPDTFGNPSKGNGANWIVSATGHPNAYAEWVSYIGIGGLMFAVTGFSLFVRKKGAPLWGMAGWVPLFCGLALSLAFGTELNRVLYFCVPGFASTGNPGRILGAAVAKIKATLIDVLVVPPWGDGEV